MLSDIVDKIGLRTVGTFAVTLLTAIWWFQPGKKKYRLPPKPWALPLIGNLYQLSTMKKRAHETFFDMSKDPKYGPVLRLQVGTWEAVVLNRIDVVREALLTRTNDFAGRPHIYSADLLTAGGKSIGFGQYGPLWAYQRKMAHAAIRKYASGEKLEQAIYGAVSKSVDAIKKENGKPFVIQPCTMLLIFNLFCRILFGLEYELDDPEFQGFVKAYQEGAEAIGTGLPADMIPFLRHLPSRKEKEMIKLMDIFYDFVKDRFREHQETFDPDNLRDLTDYVLQTKNEMEKEEGSMKDELTDTHLIYTIGDFIGAALDTLSTHFLYAVSFAAMNPEAQKKFHKELDTVLGNQLPSLKTRYNLPYTEAFIFETLRNGVTFPLGLPLATTCDTTVGGYELPKGMVVLINMWAIHHDPEHWDSPEEFQPERFLDEEGEVMPRPESFMPFSAGRRVCLGDAMAKSMLMIMVPMLFQNFTFKAPPGKEFQLEYQNSPLASIPKPFEIVAEARE